MYRDRATLACVLLVLVLATFVVACSQQEQGLSTLSSQDTQQLYPDIEPFETGHLQVSAIHEIYYELCGNRDGEVVMVLHGGPGVGSYPLLRRYFDPERFLIVLHDQRGSGKSRPLGELAENTTQDLVADIERLRTHLGLGRVAIFGGSWGSTLGLAYAETYPEHVRAMVLRGIFLATQDEVDFHYIGARRFFPAEHDALLAALPDPHRRPLPEYLFELIQGDDPALRDRCLEALNRFEIKAGSLQASDEEVTEVLSYFPPDAQRALSLVDLHYVTNRYFLDEGRLLRDAERLADIPITLINGRYDIICPPGAAHELHRRLPRSELVIADAAGHSEREPGIRTALLAAVAGTF